MKKLMKIGVFLSVFFALVSEEKVMAQEEPSLSEWLDSMRTGVYRPFVVIGSEKLDLKYRDPETETETEISAMQYDLEFTYIGIEGSPLTGEARLFYPEGAEGEIPLIVDIHYEMGAGGAAEFLRFGWMVLTPRYLRFDHGANLVGDGLNISIQLPQLAKRIPYVDQTRIGLIGGSAGGYQTLMVCAEIFPVTAAVANAPLVNLTYNLLYSKNARFNDGLKPEEMPVPIVNIVKIVADGTIKLLGKDKPGDENWRAASPVHLVDFITNPVLIPCSTADILVPIDQFGEEFIKKPAPGDFPEGFEFDLEAFVPEGEARVRLMDVLPKDDAEVFAVEVPEDAPLQPKFPPEESEEPEEKPEPPFLAPRFSEKARFSLMVYNEGAPTPRCTHLKYQHKGRFSDFFVYHFSKKDRLPKSVLTYQKLVRLMERIADDEKIKMYDRRREAETPMHRRNKLPLEKWDVVSGLHVFTDGGKDSDKLKHLKKLYSKLPDDLKNLDLWEEPEEEGGVRKRIASFEDEPIAGMLYHRAAVLYSFGDKELSEKLGMKLLEDWKGTAYAERYMEGFGGI